MHDRNIDHDVPGTSWFADENCLIAMMIGAVDHDVPGTSWLQGGG